MFPILNAAKKLRCFNILSLSRATYSININAEKLDKRTLLRLSGPDTTDYLQGMITNDVQNIEKSNCIYSLLLNFHGRVLYDTILYKTGDDEYLVEYDATGKEYLHKHLLMYRLRKKVKIEPIDTLSAWVIFHPLENNEQNNLNNLKVIAADIKNGEGFVTASLDPRLPKLGLRVIMKRDINLIDYLKSYNVNTETNSYRIFRYKLGIGEGVLDHPPGACFPFETNMDFLNGVSFQKGCYIGQELTARIHYTGVIRKRIMSVTLEPLDSYPEFPPECQIHNDKNQKLGKFRSHLGQYGLAVLNHEECLKVETLYLKNHNIQMKVAKPSWWPQDMNK